MQTPQNEKAESVAGSRYHCTPKERTGECASPAAARAPSLKMLQRKEINIESADRNYSS